MNRICVLLAFLYTTPLLAQESKLREYNSKDGLSQNSILSIAQDDLGFLWIGTAAGLNRFDGQKMTVFETIPWDTTSLENTYINVVFSDKGGRLWVGTDKGLHLYNREKQSFHRMTFYLDDGVSVSGRPITSIYEDRHGDIWFVSKNHIFRLKNQEDQIKLWPIAAYPSIPTIDSTTHFSRIILDDADYLFLTNYKTIHRFNSKDFTELPMQVTVAGMDKIWGADFLGLHLDRKDRVVLGMKQGFFHFEESETKFKPIKVAGDSPFEGFHSDKERNLYLFGGHKIQRVNASPQNDGFAYELETIADLSNFQSKFSSNMESFLIDRTNPRVIWAGFSENYSLVQIYEPATQFKPIDIAKGKNEIWSNAIFSFFDNEGETWIGTLNQIIRLDSLGKVIDIFNSGKYARIYVIKKGRQGAFWLGTANGLVKLVIDASGKLKAKPVNDNNYNGVNGIQELDNGHLLYGTYEGITFYDPMGDSIVAVKRMENSVFDRNVVDIVQDRNANFWMASYRGLYLYRDVKNPLEDFMNREPEYFSHDESDRNSLIDNFIFDIHEDKKGNIWLGTNKGIVQAKLKENGIEFTNYNQDHGLRNNVVYGFLEDKKGCLWMGTNKGLSKFDPETQSFTNFLGEAGMPGEEFNGGAFLKTAKGEMLFGGLEGCMRFFPEEIKIDSFVPPVLLTDMTTYPLKDTLVFNGKHSDTISLKYRQNSFFLHFVGLNYIDPGKTEYHYSLDGKERVALGGTGQLQIANLAPGKHVLEIFTKKWDKDPARLVIKVGTPFWRSWPFLILLVLSLGGLAFALHRLRWKEKMRQLKKFDQFRKETAQDFHDELGSQLTIISLFGEIIKDKLSPDEKTVSPYLQKVIDTSNGLYTSMKDLLWSINPEKDTIYDLLIHLKDFGDDLFDQTSIDFRSEGLNQPFVTKQLPMKYKRHILLIFKEAMTNILKHAAASQVSLKVYNGDQSLKIEITDNGKGFDTQAKNDAGNGLKNMKNRASRIASQLTIESGSTGTRIILKCDL